MLKRKALIVDFHPDSDLSNYLKTELSSLKNPKFILDYEMTNHSSIEDFVDMLSERLTDLLFLVIPSVDWDFIEALFNIFKEKGFHLPVILVLKKCDSATMVRLFNIGAMDIFVPPFKKSHIFPRVWQHLKPKTDQERIAHKLKTKLGLKQIIGRNAQFLKQIEKIPIMAKCDANVLITGETGTGKELCARAIHYLSPRVRYPFIPVNCGAIPDELVESELFGHVRGSFTGANSNKPGLIREGDHGTILLDEIDSLKPSIQVKLLRFLHDKEYRPVGSTQVCRSNIRIIAATNLNLKEAVDKGKIRQDLYYRLDVIPVMLPPLRERMDDVSILARHFLKKANLKYDKKLVDFEPEVYQKFSLYDWPGNVRELEHVIERAVIFSQGSTIRGEDIIFSRIQESIEYLSFKEAKSIMIERFERTYVSDILKLYRGNIAQSARAAQKDRRAFWRLMQKYNIKAQPYKV